MSLVPAFEIGIWNAWIFTAAFFVFSFLPFLLQLIVNKDAAARSPSTTVPLNKTEKKVDICASVILALLVIYSIFLPLQLGTAWFYTGLPTKKNRTGQEIRKTDAKSETRPKG